MDKCKCELRIASQNNTRIRVIIKGEVSLIVDIDPSKNIYEIATWIRNCSGTPIISQLASDHILLYGIKNKNLNLPEFILCKACLNYFINKKQLLNIITILKYSKQPFINSVELLKKLFK